MEAACRQAIYNGMAGDEPLIRPGIIGGALRDARRIRRRRRLAGAGALAAFVPALVFGMTALHHAPAYRGQSYAIGAERGQARPMVTPSRTLLPAHQSPFVRPDWSAAPDLDDPVPITAQSLGELLIDVLPAGAGHSQVMASVNAAGSESGLSLANFDEVTTSQGTGAVTVQLIRASEPGPEFECGAEPTGESCATYRVGGVEVNETVIDSWAAEGTMLAVTVFRPGTGLISIEENSTSVSGTAAGDALPPLTLSQLVRAALDPRWGFTVDRDFLTKASALQVGAANQG